MELQIYALIALVGHLIASVCTRDEHEEVRACGFLLAYLWPCLPPLIFGGLVIALIDYLGEWSKSRKLR